MISEDGWALKYIKKQTPEIYLVAIQLNRNTIIYV